MSVSYFKLCFCWGMLSQWTTQQQPPAKLRASAELQYLKITLKWTWCRKGDPEAVGPTWNQVLWRSANGNMLEEGWLEALHYYECLSNVHTLSLLTFMGGLALNAVYYATVLSCISDDINSVMLNRFWGNEEEKKMTYYIYPETRFNLPLYLMLYFSLSHKHMLEPLQMMKLAAGQSYHQCFPSLF